MKEPSNGTPQTAREVFDQLLQNANQAEWARRINEIRQTNGGLADQLERLIDAHLSPATFLDAPLHQTVSNSTEFETKQVGPYKLREKIGEGGFGVVYVAEQTSPLRRKVALKLIKPGMDSQQIVARFEAERQALALMDHPNIAKVLDAGATENGRPYFVMELVNGVPITKYVERQQLTIDERLALMRSVCDAVEHAHQKGIIHRDLKPSNVLVTLHDGQPVVKVIDFGVAKALHQRLTDQTVYTALGHLIGTPMYMSPEQAEMSGLDVDTRSDVYSLGVLLYELLTGLTPFDKDSFKKAGLEVMLRMIRETEPLRPSLRLSTAAKARTAIEDPRRFNAVRSSASLRGELDWIVMKALEKSRARRYQSARELGQDLENYLADRPVDAGPPSQLYRAKKYLQRNTATVAGFCAVAFLLLLGGVLLAVFAAKQQKLASDRAVFLREKEQQRVNAERIAREQSLARFRADQRLASALLEQANAVRLRRQIGYREEGFLLLRQAKELGANAGELQTQAIAYLSDPLGLPAVKIKHEDPPPPSLPEHFASIFGSREADRTKLPGNAQMAADQDMLAIPIESHLKIALHRSGKTPKILNSPLGYVHTVAISETQNKLIAACEEGFAIWQLSDLFLLNKVSTDVVWDAAIHPAVPIAAILTSTGKVVLWSLEENRFVAESAPQDCTRIEFTEDGEFLMLLGRNGSRRNLVKAFSIRSTPEARRRLAHDGGVTGVALDHTQRWLATCGKDETIKIWEFPSLRERCTLSEQAENVEELIFCPNNSWLASADWEGNVCLWDFTEGKRLATAKLNDIEVFGLQFSAGSRFLAVSGRGGIVILEVSIEGEQIEFRQVAKHLADTTVSSVAFHPSNTFVAFNSRRNFLRLDMTTGDVVTLCKTHCPMSMARSDLHFLGNGDWLTGVSHDRVPVIFDWKNDEVIAASKDGKNTDNFNAHWTRDGAIAVSRPDVFTLVVHDMKRQEVLYQLPSEKFDLWATTVSESGRWIVSGTSQGELLVWDREGIEATLASFETNTSNLSLQSRIAMGVLEADEPEKHELALATEQAKDDFESDQRDGETYWLSSRRRALAHVANNQFEDALEAVEKMNKPDEARGIVGRILGFASRERAKQPRATERLLRKLVALSSSIVPEQRATAHVLLGMIIRYRPTDRSVASAEARDQYLKTIELDPLNAAAYDQLSRVLSSANEVSLRDPEAALKAADRSMVLSPNAFTNPYTLATLAMAQYRVGSFQDSIQTSQLALDAQAKAGNPHAPLALFMAMAHWKLGRQTQAREWYDRAGEGPQDWIFKSVFAEAEEMLGPLGDRSSKVDE